MCIIAFEQQLFSKYIYPEYFMYNAVDNFTHVQTVCTEAKFFRGVEINRPFSSIIDYDVIGAKRRL